MTFISDLKLFCCWKSSICSINQSNLNTPSISSQLLLSDLLMSWLNRLKHKDHGVTNSTYNTLKTSRTCQFNSSCRADTSLSELCHAFSSVQQLTHRFESLGFLLGSTSRVVLKPSSGHPLPHHMSGAGLGKTSQLCSFYVHSILQRLTHLLH